MCVCVHMRAYVCASVSVAGHPAAVWVGGVSGAGVRAVAPTPTLQVSPPPFLQHPIPGAIGACATALPPAVRRLQGVPEQSPIWPRVFHAKTWGPRGLGKGFSLQLRPQQGGPWEYLGCPLECARARACACARTCARVRCGGARSAVYTGYIRRQVY